MAPRAKPDVTGDIVTLAAAAEATAERLTDYAYGSECFTSDQSAVLASAKAWRFFADELLKGACAAS